MTRLQDMSSITSCSEPIQLNTQASTPLERILQKIIFKAEVIVM